MPLNTKAPASNLATDTERLRPAGRKRTGLQNDQSEKPWKAFCNSAPSDIKIMEVEQEAVPNDVMMGVDGFPTYALHTKEGENKHHTGALMTPGDIHKFIAARGESS